MTEETPTYTVKTVNGQDYTGEGLMRSAFENSGINASNGENDVWIPFTNVKSVHGTLGSYEEAFDIIDPEEVAEEYDDEEDSEVSQPSTFREAVESDSIEQEFTIDELSGLSVKDEELLQEAIEVDSRKGAVSVYEDLLEDLNE